MSSTPPWEDEPPTIQQELDRKAVEELQRVMHGLTTRKVTLVQAQAHLQTLWETCAGLIPTESMNLVAQSLTAVGAELSRRNPPHQRIVFFRGEAMVSVSRRGVEVIVTSRSPVRALETKTHRFDAESTADSKCKELIDELERMGFQVLP
jgi:hypothetical protein